MECKPKIINRKEVKPTSPSDGVYEYWLTNKDTPTENISYAYVIFEKGISSGEHIHSAEEIFYFVKGTGKIIVNNEEYDIKPDLCVYVPKNISHNIIGTKDSNIEVFVTIGSTEIETKYF